MIVVQRSFLVSSLRHALIQEVNQVAAEEDHPVTVMEDFVAEVVVGNIETLEIGHQAEHMRVSVQAKAEMIGVTKMVNMEGICIGGVCHLQRVFIPVAGLQ